MTDKQTPIRKKVRRVVLAISMAALLAATAVSIMSMLRIQTTVVAGGKQLGETAARDSEQALLAQMENSLLSLVESKAEIADANLGKFSDYINLFADYANELYRHPENYKPLAVLPPDAANAGVPVMQRYLSDSAITLDAVWDEVQLLGNMANVFAPALAENRNMITTIYVGTASGALLSYDTGSDLADTDAPEEYHYFADSSWYPLAREAGKAVFTDTYLDGYGRGLTISCAAPFYDADGSFAGVVCMDILISDLNNTIINTDIGANSYAFLLDAKGNIIASPYMEQDSEDYINIFNDADAPAHSIADQIMSEQSGITQNDADVYFAHTPIRSADWTLAIHVPSSDITAPVVKIRNTISSDTATTAAAMQNSFMTAILVFAVAFAAIIAVVIFFSNRFSRRITSPLMELNEGVRVVSSGKLDYFIDIHTGDELETLANSFNKMTKDLLDQMINLRRVTAEKERIGAELGVATHIQASMLPCIFPAFPGRAEFDIYASMQPAKEVGGDFYDFFLVDDNHLAMVMADVSGKGVPAALFMVIAKTLIKNIAQTGLGPKEVLEKANNQLCENNEAEMFVTVWLGILEISTGKMICANAGHEFPSVQRANGDFELIRDKHGFVLAGMEGSKYKEYEITLEKGDRLFVYTDGVAEATNAADELYGTDRMIDALNRNKDASCEALLHHMKEDIDLFVGDAPQFDDITMLSLEMRRNPE